MVRNLRLLNHKEVQNLLNKNLLIRNNKQIRKIILQVDKRNSKLLLQVDRKMIL
jgi:hypothetical protein